MLDSDRMRVTAKRLGITSANGSVNVFGITFAPLQYTKLSNNKKLQQRLIVTHVHKKSPFATHMIAPGSVLHQINNINVYTIEDVVRVFILKLKNNGTVMKVKVSALGVNKEFMTETVDSYEAEEKTKVFTGQRGKQTKPY